MNKQNEDITTYWNAIYVVADKNKPAAYYWQERAAPHLSSQNEHLPIMIMSQDKQQMPCR